MAEKGALAALQHLAVEHPEPFSHLTPEQRELRNKLRAKGRQLGDTLDARGRQTIDALTTECAYEYWHRMLFARFLAENHLLMHPEGVSVSLDDCDELAAEEGALDGWTLAARYASRMLPQIFRQDDPVLAVTFAPEHKKALEKLLSDLPDAIFLADDSLGWVYQFWQKRRKDEINASDEKIDGQRLPAVTQLFTEHYMVQFLLDNTIGAWWVAHHPDVPAPIEFPYLRRLEDGSPAAGTFPGWPDRLAELKVLDPCMGSGHILVTAFSMLTALRMVEEHLSAQAAVDSVLRDNLFGLEIDPRCTQIAAFALALAAWRFPNAGGYRELPQLNLACCGIAPRGKREEWRKLAGDDLRLQNGMTRLYETFEQAAELGSLINTGSTENDLLTASFAELRPLLDKALEGEKSHSNYEQSLRGIVAQGLSRAAELLGEHYHLAITNVPYLTRSKQSEILARFCIQEYSDSKNDLATVFLERILKFCITGGVLSIVTPQNWYFLTSYTKLRGNLLNNVTWNLIAELGTKGFQTPMWDFNVSLSILTNSKPSFKHSLVGVDVSNSGTPQTKSVAIRSEVLKIVKQSAQLENPDLRIIIGELSKISLLSQYAESYVGLQNGDTPKNVFLFWEISYPFDKWEFFQLTTDKTDFYLGRSGIVRWPALPEYLIKGTKAWNKNGILIRQTAKLPATLYNGSIYDQSSSAIIPHDERNLAAIWAFCSSPEYHKAVRRIDKKLNVTNATFVKVPFDLERWQKVADEMGPLPEPYSNDPTQWLFKGNIPSSTSPLHVAVARLLGYHWPDQPDDPVMDHLEDTDGIVCFPAVSGELPAAERLREFLAKAYGELWSANVLNQLLSDVGCAGWTLDKWLREKFFEQHCKLFHQRPFIWHIWDGRRNGFAALVNYHKLDHKRLERLTYTYLNDWIRRQEDRLKHDESGAEGLLLAARQLQDKLKLILDGEPPYDIFVRWKPLEAQPIGWNPDLNDGVRLNIRPFVEANILRKKPNIKWKKDRGKNPPGAPWGEERHNDRHLTNAEKREAREALKPEKALLSA